MKYLALNKDKIPALVNELNLLLANYQVYNQKLKNYHWNIKGRNFFEIHKQFEEMYSEAHIHIDQIAERVRILKSKPLSTLKQYLEKSEIKEIDNFLNDRHAIEAILNDHYILLKNARRVLRNAEAAGDEGTTDLISGIMRYIEKKSWMFDSWLVQPSEMIVEMNSLS